MGGDSGANGSELQRSVEVDTLPMALAAVQAWLQPPTFLWTTTPWACPKPPASPYPSPTLHLLSVLQPPPHAGMGTSTGTVPLSSFHAQAMPGLCAALQTSVFWEGEEHMATGKTTARAWRQPVTGFSPVPAVVGDFMPPCSVATACTTQAAIMVQTPSPGCAGMGQGCREPA